MPTAYPNGAGTMQVSSPFIGRPHQASRLEGETDRRASAQRKPSARGFPVGGIFEAAATRDSDLLLQRFLTMLFAILAVDEDELALELVSAGHPPPLVRRGDGTVERVSVAGPLIGLRPSASYGSGRVRLSPGDSLLMYTDGLTDARAPTRILSEDDLMELLVQGRDLSGGELAQFLEKSATGKEDPRDDIALMLIEPRPGSTAASSPEARARLTSA